MRRCIFGVLVDGYPDSYAVVSSKDDSVKLKQTGNKRWSDD